MENQIAKDLTRGPVMKQLAVFALPLALANALQAVYSMVDMIVVGNFVGPEGLSAVGIGGSLMNLLLCIGMGLGFGAQVLLSQQVGAGDKNLQNTIGTLFTLEFVFSVIFGVLGAFLAEPLMSLLNTPEAAWQDTKEYTLVCCAGMLFIYGYNAVCGILRGMGESRLPMIFIAIASVVNLLLDLVFVAGLKMSAAGAALATVMAQAVAFLVSVVYLYRNRERFGFDFKLQSFKPSKRHLGPIFKIGIPYIAQTLMIFVSMMFVNANVNSYGVTASAVDSIGNKLNSIGNIVIGAISMAGATMVGQCFGARNFDRIKQCVRACTVVCVVAGAVICLGYLLLPKQIFGLFTSDEAVLAMAPRYLMIAVVWVVSIISMTPPYAVVDGIGYAAFGLFACVMDGVVARIGLCILLGRFLGLEGFWLGNALAGFASTILCGGYYFSGRWKNRDLLLKN